MDSQHVWNTPVNKNIVAGNCLIPLLRMPKLTSSTKSDLILKKSVLFRQCVFLPAGGGGVGLVPECGNSIRPFDWPKRNVYETHRFPVVQFHGITFEGCTTALSNEPYIGDTIRSTMDRSPPPSAPTQHQLDVKAVLLYLMCACVAQQTTNGGHKEETWGNLKNPTTLTHGLVARPFEPRA